MRSRSADRDSGKRRESVYYWLFAGLLVLTLTMIVLSLVSAGALRGDVASELTALRTATLTSRGNLEKALSAMLEIGSQAPEALSHNAFAESGITQLLIELQAHMRSSVLADVDTIIETVGTNVFDARSHLPAFYDFVRFTNETEAHVRRVVAAGDTPDLRSAFNDLRLFLLSSGIRTDKYRDFLSIIGNAAFHKIRTLEESKLAATLHLSIASTASLVFLLLTGLAYVHDRKEAERALIRAHSREKRAFDIINSGPAVVFIWSSVPPHRVLFVSDNVERVFGYSAREFLSGERSLFELVHPEDQGCMTERFVGGYNAGDGTWSLEEPRLTYRVVDSEGVTHWVEDVLHIRPNSEGIPEEIAGIVTDVTERTSLEDQLRQSQKMEAVGRLAGGIAHDFNNQLTTILGYSEIISSRKDDIPQEVADSAAEIVRAGEHASALTGRLLAFSRKQVVQPIEVDVGARIQDIQAMVARMVGEDVQLHVNVAAESSFVFCDPVQLDQIVFNLAVNAREAMPNGGTLELAAELRSLSEERKAFQTIIPPGDYVVVTAHDTGVGIPPEILDRIFEPFFTTKTDAQGTGLGLATVYGIVKRWHGHIDVDSSPETGTTFTLYVPRLSKKHPHKADEQGTHTQP